MPTYRTVERDHNARSAKRIFAVGALFACAFGALVSRAVAFHLKDNAQLEEVALRQYRTAVHQSTHRGRILDAAGRELAIDVTVESVWANPREVDDPVILSEKLSKILGVERRRLLERLSTGRKFVWVKRRASGKEIAVLGAQDLPGVFTLKESSRSYPGKALAATVLGAVGFDAEPLGGVELAYHEALAARGRAGNVRRDARGHLYLSPAGEEKAPGVADVTLTIDRMLQYLAEQELARAVHRARAKGGSAVVVDVQTGAVLAMANLPTFDPNDYGKFDLATWRNRAISDAHEPGSTFKTIVVSAALDAGAVTPQEIFDCQGGSIRIGANVVHDAHPHRKLSVADIIRVSSNIGAYKVEERLGMERAEEGIRAFGFGRPTGIDLPGESGGLLSPSRQWSELQFATIAFGQGVAATSLQMTMAFAAVANGGLLLRPRIVSRVVGEDGEELFSGGRQIVGRPISESTARTMAALLERVTQKGGTGTLAASAEYPVAGKTGTAQKVDARSGGYAPGRYYSSFVGFAPADAPRIAVYVGIDEPGGGMYYGGQVAAPAFREIVEGTLHYLKVPGSVVVAEGEGEKLQPPSSSQTEELALIERAGQERPQLVPAEEGAWCVPDLRGLTMRGVLEAAGPAQIAWRFQGSGVAVKQSCGAGGAVAAGAECTVEFAPLM